MLITQGQCAITIWKYGCFTPQTNLALRILRQSFAVGDSNDLNMYSVPWPQIAKFMGPPWGPPGSCRSQVGPMLAPWTLLSGLYQICHTLGDSSRGRPRTTSSECVHHLIKYQPFYHIFSCIQLFNLDLRISLTISIISRNGLVAFRQLTITLAIGY